MIKKVFLVLSISLLIGCSGLSYVIDNYSGIQPEKFSYAGEDWRIFHKPNEKRLMITPSMGTAMAGGFKQGATLFLAGRQSDPENRFRTASMIYVQTKVSESCEITTGKLLIDPQYEYYYEC
ncbi:MAG: hypothetical protein HOH59_11795 [Rhodospirillaceae bacterium]|jgi:hypothetical protein|nr:hypothetical protein [Rhodospirillaceae bacterium]